jgi:hypothetical protein
MPGEQWLRIPARPIRRKGINQFQRIAFLPALLIDEPRFFIGWKEPVAGEVVVGLDISNDTGEKIFVNTTGSWYQNVDVHGSLMVRPVFGSGVIDTSVGVEEERRSAVYPNPNTGSFYIEGAAQDITIHTLTGSAVPFKSEPDTERTEIRIISARPGLYVLRYRSGQRLRSEKIVIAP